VRPLSKEVLGNAYSEFPQADTTASEFSIPVRIYPVYQEVAGAGTILPRIESELRYLKTKVLRPTEDPYASLRLMHYQDDKQDPLLDSPSPEEIQGFWAMEFNQSSSGRAALQGLPR